MPGAGQKRPARVVMYGGGPERKEAGHPHEDSNEKSTGRESVDPMLSPSLEEIPEIRNQGAKKKLKEICRRIGDEHFQKFQRQKAREENVKPPLSDKRTGVQLSWYGINLQGRAPSTDHWRGSLNLGQRLCQTEQKGAWEKSEGRGV